MRPVLLEFPTKFLLIVTAIALSACKPADAAFSGPTRSCEEKQQREYIDEAHAYLWYYLWKTADETRQGIGINPNLPDIEELGKWNYDDLAFTGFADLSEGAKGFSLIFDYAPDNRWTFSVNFYKNCEIWVSGGLD